MTVRQQYTPCVRCPGRAPGGRGQCIGPSTRRGT
ncbi:hypothetical protein E4L96_13350 [Massilia arenosa]|uniref:Uncharacterized protein n=1 Tax=Zemynaea arenosa TaxID=2561931 RepID=A0A4Y9SCW5_9BURK|nr:hypothetical protein E4L96_13350 [Massilia arenosa]